MPSLLLKIRTYFRVNYIECSIGKKQGGVLWGNYIMPYEFVELIF